MRSRSRVNVSLLVLLLMLSLADCCQAQEPEDAKQPQILVLDTTASVFNEADNSEEYRFYRGDVIDFTRKTDDRYYTVDPDGWMPASGVIELDNALQALSGRGRRRRNDPDTQANRALVLMAEGKLDEAEKNADQLLTNVPDHVAGLITRALIHLEQADYEKAQPDLEKAFRRDASNVQTILLLIRCERAKENYQFIVDFLQTVPVDVDADPDLLIERAYCEWMVLKSEEALASIDRAIELGTKRADAWHTRGNILMSIGRLEEAVETFTLAIERNPEAINSYYFRADCLGQLGEYGPAIDDYTRLLEADSSDHSARIARGRLYRTVNETQLAREDFDYVATNAEDKVVVAEATFLRGLTAEDSGNAEEAFKDYSRSIELDPTQAAPLRERGRLNFSFNDPTAAEKDLLQAIEIDSEDSLALRFLGDLYRLQERSEDSLEAYTDAIEIDPDDAVAWNNRGIVHEMLNQPEDAIENYEIALTLRPGDTTFATNLAALHRNRGEHDQADRRLAEVIEAFQGEDQSPLAEIYYHRGENARFAQKLEQAVEFYREAIQLNGQHANAHNSCGICLDQLGQSSEAIDCYNAALKLSPGSAVILVNRGDAFRNSGELQAALDDYDEAVRQSSDYTIAYNQRGLLYLNVSNYELAARDFRKALELNPEYTLARANLADTLRYDQKLVDAIAEYSLALVAAPLNVSLLYGRGECYRQLNRRAEAEAAYRTALAQDNNYDLAWVGLGELYEEGDQLAGAVDFYTRAIEITPDYLWALYRRGFCLSLLNRDEECITDFDRVLELNPDHLNARLFRANSYRDLEQFEKALPDYERALQVDDEYVYMFLGRGLCFEMMEQYGAAIDDYSKVIELEPTMSGGFTDRARLHASVTDPSIFNPKQALRDAKKACTLTENNDPIALEALAMAHAAGGEFDSAAELQKQAIRLAEERGTYNNQYLREANERLKLYTKRKPYVLATRSKDTRETPKTSPGKPATKPSATRRRGSEGLTGGAGSLFGSSALPKDKEPEAPAPPAEDSEIPAPPAL
ncbi:tetratricopeptide repeat protein [Rubinisphaera margarita]|uniref:tetratricopeptide repeat protein n=1 Tax=Rubinisphaera margarita TaxID=2909586 RepID=UPI001EE7C2E3|nr:tetratricopeptide repeat protein [Rubinisphaera margarita]MCG6158420.1 tetratricopeptide repeat protein [Rubinisphaera margarita]